MQKSRKCRTVLLNDSPAEKDGFGTHARVAGAIAELIRSGASGGKVIGLEGGWGTGKTTVIRLLEAELSDQREYKVVTFDSWAHEDDHLRRTFLESLISDIQDEGWVDRERWDRKLDEITNRRKKSSTRTIPTTTPLGVVFSISLLAFPLGLTLLSVAMKSSSALSTPSNSTGTSSGLLILGVFLSLAWVGVLLCNLVRHGFRKARGKSTDRVWNLLLSDAITEVTTETVETPEPTSVEFDRYFTHLLHESVGEHPDRQLVLVIDNLDRVDRGQALGLWSTLQTFLQDRDRNANQWFDRLWVIVPYDPNGLRSLWDSHVSVKPPDGVTTERDGPQRKGNSIEKATTRNSDSFLDKIFRIRFRVPRPLLSNWRDYLLDLSSEAFPEHNKDTLLPLLNVFEVEQQRIGAQPTPRDIKAYINQVGAIHLQWEHCFSFAHSAYYVILARRNQSIADHILAGLVPEDEFRTVMGSNVQESLAGLEFNVDQKTGQEILLRDPIYVALTTPNAEDLIQLATNVTDGFWAVLANVVATKLGSENGRTCARAATCLQEAQLDSEHREFPAILGAIVASLRSESNWCPLDESTANGIAAACHLMGDNSFSSYITNAVAESHAQEDGSGTESSVDLLALSRSWLSVLRAVSDLGHEDAAQTTLEITCDIAGWVSVCQELFEQDVHGRHWGRFRSTATATELSQYLETAVAGGTFSDEHLCSILVSSSIAQPPKWRKLIVAMQTRLQGTVSAPAPEAKALLRALLELRRLAVREGDAAAKAFNEAGHYLHHLHAARVVNDREFVALCTFLSLVNRPNAEKPPVAGNSEAGHAELMKLLKTGDEDIAAELAKITVRFGDDLALLGIREARKKWDPLAVQWLRSLVGHADAKSFFTGGAVLRNWGALDDALSDSEPGFCDLVAILQENGTLVQETMRGGFSVQDTRLYTYLIADESVSDELLVWCRNGLEKLDCPGWISALDDNTYGVELALALAESGYQPTLRTHYLDAHADHAHRVLDGTQSSHTEADRWEAALALLTGGLRSDLASKILEVAFKGEGKVSAAFLTLYGGVVAEYDQLANSVEAAKRLFAPIVRVRGLDELQWLRDVIRMREDVQESCRTGKASEILRSRLAEGMRNSEGDEEGVKATIVEIANLLGVDSIQDGDPTEEEELDDKIEAD